MRIWKKKKDKKQENIRVEYMVIENREKKWLHKQNQQLVWERLME